MTISLTQWGLGDANIQNIAHPPAPPPPPQKKKKKTLKYEQK